MSNSESNPDLPASSAYVSTYLSIHEVEGLIKAYEIKPTAENLSTLISFLLSFAFSPEEGWVIKYAHDNERKQNNYFIMKVNKEGTHKDNKRTLTLHTLVKVISNLADPFPEEWEQTVPNLGSAPMNEDRCWAILIRGLEVRLLEYHRDQEPGARVIPCDFVIENKSCETVHIRNNVTEVNSILTLLPGKWPTPLSATELTNLASQHKAAKARDSETESSSDKILESSKSTLSETRKAPTPEAKPTIDSQAVSEIMVPASQVKQAAAETKSTISLPKVTPKAKPATQSETFAPDKSTAPMQDLTKDLMKEELNKTGLTKVQSDKAKVVAQDKPDPQNKATKFKDFSQFKPTSQGRINPQAQEKIAARLKSMTDELTKEDFKIDVKAKIQSDKAEAAGSLEAANKTKLVAQDKASAESDTTAPTKTSFQPKSAAGNESSQKDFLGQARKLAQLKPKAAIQPTASPQTKPTAPDETTPSTAVSPKSKGDDDG